MLIFCGFSCYLIRSNKLKNQEVVSVFRLLKRYITQELICITKHLKIQLNAKTAKILSI